MAQNKYSVRLARRADKMLLAHTEFLAKVNISVAHRLLIDFKKIKDKLAENPFFPDDTKHCLLLRKTRAFFN